MSRLIWIILILLLLLPTTAGKILINFAGGVFLLISLITLLIGGLGWGGWKYIQSKMVVCTNCGANYIKQSSSCPICGYQEPDFKKEINNSVNTNTPASSVTIDITPQKDQSEK